MVHTSLRPQQSRDLSERLFSVAMPRVILVYYRSILLIITSSGPCRHGIALDPRGWHLAGTQDPLDPESEKKKARRISAQLSAACATRPPSELLAARTPPARHTIRPPNPPPRVAAAAAAAFRSPSTGSRVRRADATYRSAVRSTARSR